MSSPLSISLSAVVPPVGPRGFKVKGPSSETIYRILMSMSEAERFAFFRAKGFDRKGNLFALLPTTERNARDPGGMIYRPFAEVAAGKYATAWRAVSHYLRGYLGTRGGRSWADLMGARYVPGARDESPYLLWPDGSQSLMWG